MYNYKAFGLNIYSEISLPELGVNDFYKPDIIIRYGSFNLSSGKSVVELIKK